MRTDTRRWIEADRRHSWHPFTDQAAWETQDPLVLTGGEGVWLIDSEGHRYLDGNASIWTNIHGHCHPKLVEALQKQSAELCHSSYLGFTNARASELAERLCHLSPSRQLTRCFFSDNGSTALEVALKMSLQWWSQQGEATAKERTGIIAFERAYHGDTLGAASIGGVSRFVKGYGETGLQIYRVAGMDDLRNAPEVVTETTAAVVIEPLIQGVNEMQPWPDGMLTELRQWCDAYDIHLILDEVMTGFGRTGRLFACEHESVIPDFLCLAKGLTGGTMPLAATLTRKAIYDGFRGTENTFYYGHSYTGNSLGCAVALANLDLFESENTLANVEPKGRELAAQLTHPIIKDVRRRGLILGVEIEGDGTAFCLALRKRGILTRPILNTIVVMPPLSISDDELDFYATALLETCAELSS